MSERSRLNVGTADLEILTRLAAAQREIGEIADSFHNTRFGSKKEERHDAGRKLNAIKASLRSVELRLAENLDTKGDDS